MTTGERLPLASVIRLPPCCMKRSTYESMRPAVVVGPNDPDGMPFGVFAGPA